MKINVDLNVSGGMLRSSLIEVVNAIDIKKQYRFRLKEIDHTAGEFDEDSVTLVLPYPISTNRYWRTFTPKGSKRAHTVLSQEAKDYKKAVENIAHAAGIRSPINGRVGVQYVLVPKRPLDWAKRAKKDPEGWGDTVQCIDLDNSVKVLMDALNGVVIDDDKWARKIIIERGEPEDVAKLVVTVFKIEKQQSPQQTFGI